jgi:hypothetical protein
MGHSDVGGSWCESEFVWIVMQTVWTLFLNVSELFWHFLNFSELFLNFVSELCEFTKVWKQKQKSSEKRRLSRQVFETAFKQHKWTLAQSNTHKQPNKQTNKQIEDKTKQRSEPFGYELSQPVSLSACQAVRLSGCQSVSLSVRLCCRSVLSVCQSLCRFCLVCRSVSLSVCACRSPCRFCYVFS